MTRIFFNGLHLPQPSYNLGGGSESHGHQAGKMLAGIEDILRKEKPDIAYVQGDDNHAM